MRPESSAVLSWLLIPNLCFDDKERVVLPWLPITSLDFVFGTEKTCSLQGMACCLLTNNKSNQYSELLFAYNLQHNGDICVIKQIFLSGNVGMSGAMRGGCWL